MPLNFFLKERRNINVKRRNVKIFCVLDSRMKKALLQKLQQEGLD